MIPLPLEMGPLRTIKTQLRVLRYDLDVTHSTPQLAGWWQCVHKMGGGTLTLPLLCVQVSLFNLQYMDYVPNPNHSCSELRSSLLCQSGYCGSLQQYSSGLRGILSVSARAVTRGKEDLGVWRRWKMEP